MEKLLSICVPTWNRKSKLERLLGNISDESAGIEGRIEVCISNNGSDDGTREFLDENSGSYPFEIRVNHNGENAGFDANLLKVVEMGRGKWLWILGDDDLIVEGKLRALAEELENAKGEVCIVHPNFVYVLDEEGKKLSGPVDTGESIARRDTGYKSMIFSPQAYISRVILRRDKFAQIGHEKLEGLIGNVEMHMWMQRYIGFRNPGCKSKFLEDIIVLNSERGKYVRFSDQLKYSYHTNRNYRIFFWHNKFNPKMYSVCGRFIPKIITTSFFPAFHITGERVFREDSREEVPLSFFTGLYGWSGAAWYLYRECAWKMPKKAAELVFSGCLLLSGERRETWKEYWNQGKKNIQDRSWV